MHLSYTAGEAVISTVENDSTVLTQGFHQPNYVVTALEYTFLPGAVSVFPNPTSALLNVRLAGLPMENVTITLFDPAGRLMLTAKMDADLWQTNLADWPGGCYWLRVSDAKTRQSGSFKIFKSN